MDFEIRYATKLEDAMKRAKSRFEQRTEEEKLADWLESERGFNAVNEAFDEIMERLTIIESPEKVERFHRLVSMACSTAEMCSLDIKVHLGESKRGLIELRSNNIALFNGPARSAVAKLLEEADDFYACTVKDATVALQFWYELYNVAYKDK